MDRHGVYVSGGGWWFDDCCFDQDGSGVQMF